MTEVGEARERIWAAAQEEFAVKGLAGARVDEIARRARVNKALIYYYFKSKEQLLHTIVEDFFAALLEHKTKLSGQGCFTDEEHRRCCFVAMFDFLRQRKLAIRIVLREMVKGEAAATDVIAMLEPLTRLYAQHLGELGFDIGPDDARLVIRSTFFGLVPMLMFVTLEERMAKGLAMDADAVAELFHEAGNLAHNGLMPVLSEARSAG